MTSTFEALDENCIKLIQIYQLLKSNGTSCKNNSRIKAILANDFNINYRLPSSNYTYCNEPQYSGNTALHFLAEFNHYNCKPCLDLFIERGADFNIQNDNGCTPLLLAFQKGYKIDDLLLVYIKKNLLKNIRDKNGISHFYVTCTTNHLEAIDNYLGADISVDERVNDDSPKYSGYTALHFAALHEQFKTMELLLAHGANINSKDVNGITPLNLLINKFKESNFDKEFLLKIFPLTILPDGIGLTKLHINCIVNYTSLFKRSLNEDIDIDSAIKFDSPVWPGYTPLHLVSQFNLSKVILLLEKGADLLAKNASGTTPFDLCLRQYSLDEIIQILSIEKRHCLSRIKFTDGTSLLDVLCVFKHTGELKQFIETKVKNINITIPSNSLIWPGCNLLHLAVMFDKSVNFLLYSNVDFTMQNADGMSPLHLAFYLKKDQMVNNILNYHETITLNPKDRNNLSHLHIACAAQNSKVVKHLLNNGSDLNLPLLKDIQYTFSYVHMSNNFKAGTTPFDIAVSWIEDGILHKFMRFRVNLDKPDADGVTLCSLKKAEMVKHFFSMHGLILGRRCKKNQCEIIIDSMFKSDVEARITNQISFRILKNILVYVDDTNLFYMKVIEKFLSEKRYEELGLTRLQVACALGDLSIVNEELKSGADVNRQISFDSDLWPGDTALHINSKRKEFPSRASKIQIAKILLAHGANPSLKNANNLTPIHLGENWELDAVLLSSCKNFSIENPANNDGLSHFHLSFQTSNLILIKEFIKSGVNVNTPVNYFADRYAGYTPLHFAIDYSSKEVIELLLAHGADPNIKAANGLTPFYKAVARNINPDLIDVLLKSPMLNVHYTDITGKPLLMQALENCLCEYGRDFGERTITLLLNRGICMSMSNIITQESRSLHNQIFQMPNHLFKLLVNNIFDILDIDEQGQNIMYHISTYHLKNPSIAINNITTLVRSGCEINFKNKKGDSPLHVAIDENRIDFVNLLLSLGADINIMNDEGKTALTHAFEKCKIDYYNLKPSLLKHLKHMKKAGLYIDKSNEAHLDNSTGEINTADEETAEKQIFDTKLKERNSKLSADYFFTERFVIEYQSITALRRQAICNICDSDNLSQEFPVLHDLIRLQFSKARARTRLLEPAAAAFQSHVDQVIPQLCLESILKYLGNGDLMNLVRSANGKLVFAPLLENY